MTTREEIKSRIDSMSDATFSKVADFVENEEASLEAQADELERLLLILAEPLPPEEQRELMNDLKRRPFRTPPQ